MTKGEVWKRFFEGKGWLVDDVVRGNDGESIKITIGSSCKSSESGTSTFDAVLIMKEYDVLCGELPAGSVFFQWDDIAHVMVGEGKKNKGGWF
jgi:hypothetical protein